MTVASKDTYSHPQPQTTPAGRLIPFSLKDALALIEVQLPVNCSSWERYAELVEAAETRFGDVRPVFRHDLTTAEKNRLIGEYLCTLPYNDRLTCCLRPEECDESLHKAFGTTGYGDRARVQYGLTK